MVTETMIDAMVSRIVERFHPLRVILCGSQGRGTATASSDVDLLVVLEAAPPSRSAAR